MFYLFRCFLIIVTPLFYVHASLAETSQFSHKIAQPNNLSIPVIGFGHYKNTVLKPLPKRIFRVLVGKDHPPFNYRGESGKITGFNIEIAQAICIDLNISCQIIAKNWKSLKSDISQKHADFAVTSMAISKQNLLAFELTKRYYDMPARFISRKNSILDRSVPHNLRNKNIGVVANSGHEAYIFEFFSEANIHSFPNLNLALESLKEGKMMTIFADALSVNFWLNSQVGKDCCRYASADFYEARFFGEGAAITLAKDNQYLRDWINRSLANIWASGRYEEIFTKYFTPNNTQ